jgi:hypothetical protein
MIPVNDGTIRKDEIISYQQLDLDPRGGYQKIDPLLHQLPSFVEQISPPSSPRPIKICPDTWLGI